MSSLPQKPSTDPRELKKLLETYSAREVFQITAARIILANERTRDGGGSRVLTEDRKVRVTEKELEDIRRGRFGRIQLPTEEEARHWLQQWREGAKPMHETPTRKIVIQRNRAEVRE